MKEFQMTQEEMNKLISINTQFVGRCGDAGYLSRLYSMQKRTEQLWEELGKKYGFDPATVETSSNSGLFFKAQPIK